jgi:hypothetical protein
MVTLGQAVQTQHAPGAHLGVGVLVPLDEQRRELLERLRREPSERAHRRAPHDRVGVQERVGDLLARLVPLRELPFHLAPAEASELLLELLRVFPLLHNLRRALRDFRRLERIELSEKPFRAAGSHGACGSGSLAAAAARPLSPRRCPRA